MDQNMFAPSAAAFADNKDEDEDDSDSDSDSDSLNSCLWSKINTPTTNPNVTPTYARMLMTSPAPPNIAPNGDHGDEGSNAKLLWGEYVICSGFDIIRYWF